MSPASRTRRAGPPSKTGAKPRKAAAPRKAAKARKVAKPREAVIWRRVSRRRDAKQLAALLATQQKLFVKVQGPVVHFVDATSGKTVRILRAPVLRSTIGSARIKEAVAEVARTLGASSGA